MVQEVYVDLYFLVNFSMDLLCLLLTASLVHRRITRPRAAIAAAIGGVYAVLSLLFGAQGAVGLLCDLAAAVVLCTVAFHARGTRLPSLLRVSAVFALTSMILGGIMTALYSGLNRLNLPFESLQGDGLSVWTFALLTAVAGVATLRGGRLIGLSRKTKSATVEATLFGRQVRLCAMVDTGNLLRDPVSGRAVIVCDYNAISKALPPMLATAYRSGDFTACLTSYEFATRLRPVPTKTASGEAVLFAIVPDALTVTEVDGRSKKSAPYSADYLLAPTSLGAATQGFDALIGIG